MVAPPIWLVVLVGPPTTLCASAGEVMRARIVIAKGRHVLLVIRRSLFMFRQWIR